MRDSCLHANTRDICPHLLGPASGWYELGFSGFSRHAASTSAGTQQAPQQAFRRHSASTQRALSRHSTSMQHALGKHPARTEQAFSSPTAGIQQAFSWQQIRSAPTMQRPPQVSSRSSSRQGSQNPNRLWEVLVHEAQVKEFQGNKKRNWRQTDAGSKGNEKELKKEQKGIERSVKDKWKDSAGTQRGKKYKNKEIKRNLKEVKSILFIRPFKGIPVLLRRFLSFLFWPVFRESYPCLRPATKGNAFRIETQKPFE